MDEKRKTLQQRNEEQILKQIEETQKIVRCFDRLVKTEDGLFALQVIFQETQWGQYGLPQIPSGGVSPEVAFAKIGRASLWADIRRVLSREALIAIEYPETKTQEKETKG